MGDADKVTIHNRSTGPGSTPQKPLALVAKMTDSERRALESRRRGGFAEPNSTMSPEIRYRTSVLHFYFSFRNILTIGGSVLSGLRQQF